MKTKRLLRLGVRVPNEGARRLAQFIMRHPAGTLDKLMRRTGMGFIAIDRMMAGEMTPLDGVGYQIYVFTGGEVSASDWEANAEGGWFTPALIREPMRRAA